MKEKAQRLGFTLIELLVVISIIGILASLLLARYTSAEKSARDTQRKSDLNQYRIALENFSVVKGGLYPSYTTPVDASDDLCTTSLGTTYLAFCPKDPLQEPPDEDQIHFYRYQSDGTGTPNINASQYILWVGTETANYWYICANGKSSAKETAPVASDCGFL